MKTDNRGLKVGRVKVEFNLAPFPKAVIRRMLLVAEREHLVEVIKTPNKQPAYVVHEGRKVKPLEFWQAFRRAAFERTDVPDATTTRAKRALEEEEITLITYNDCIFLLQEAFAKWRQAT